MRPDILFNYLGQFDTALHTTIYELSSLSTGNSVSPDRARHYNLEINGMVTGGCLTFDFSYSKAVYKEDTIEKLAESYKEKLLSITEHCASKGYRK